MKQTSVEWLVEMWDKNQRFLNAKQIIEQAKEMEKEQIIEFAEFLCTYPDKNKNVYGEILHAKSKYDSSYTTKEVFKEFINNYYGK